MGKEEYMKHLIAFKKAITAGILIGIGCTVYLSMDNKVVASFLFGLGLLTIINFELNLFTGKIGYLNKENWLEILITLFGNAFGITITSTLIIFSRIGSKMIENSTSIVDIKLNDSYLSLFILAIFCGMLMFTAVESCKRRPNMIGIVAVFLCVSVFIMAGFEHCIANIYYFTMASRLPDYILPLIVMILGNSTGGIVLNFLVNGCHK